MPLLSNSSALDITLRKAIKEISESSSSDQVKEAHILTLYRIKQTIERNSQPKKAVSTSKKIGVNQVVALTPESGGRFLSRLVSNLKGGIAAEIPVDKNGTQIRWPRGSLVTLFFWKANGQGFSFQSKISGYSTVRGVPCLMVKHSNAVHEAQQRRYRRKPLERPCYFYPVRIMVVGTGKNAEKKAYTETKNHTLGTVLEVSVGGCSIKTTYPLGKGSLIKVEFETGKKAQIAAYGKVVSMVRIKPLGGIMHVMFTRLSQSHMNKINAYIYELTAERKP
jgi:c-di-GMP-binding flagellar brake protein YcgR